MQTSFTALERAILQAAADYPEFSPGKPEALAECRRLVAVGYLKELRPGRFENTAKGERAFHYATGNGAAHSHRLLLG